MSKVLKLFSPFFIIQIVVERLRHSDCDDGVLLYFNLELLNKRRSYFHYEFFTKKYLITIDCYYYLLERLHFRINIIYYIY